SHFHWVEMAFVLAHRRIAAATCSGCPSELIVAATPSGTDCVRALHHVASTPSDAGGHEGEAAQCQGAGFGDDGRPSQSAERPVIGPKIGLPHPVVSRGDGPPA